jgi:hypothetical protein
LLLRVWATRLEPIVNDLAVDNAKDGNSCFRYWLTSWSDALILSLVSTVRCPAVRNFITLGDYFFYSDVEIGEARAKSRDYRFEFFDPTKPFKLKFWITEFVERVHVTFVPGFLNVPLNESLVRFD